MKLEEVPESEYRGYFSTYVNIIGNVDLMEELEISLHDYIRFVREIPMDKFDYRYAEGKWTLKDIIQHIIDAERIFAYRALRFSRQDKTPLPGFEENEYAENTNANARSIQDLLSEFAVVRQATLSLFKSFTPGQMTLMGTASEKQLSVRAIGFVIIGHQKHHQKVFQERYL